MNTHVHEHTHTHTHTHTHILLFFPSTDEMDSYFRSDSFTHLSSATDPFSLSPPPPRRPSPSSIRYSRNRRRHHSPTMPYRPSPPLVQRPPAPTLSPLRRLADGLAQSSLRADSPHPELDFLGTAERTSRRGSDPPSHLAFLSPSRLSAHDFLPSASPSPPPGLASSSGSEDSDEGPADPTDPGDFDDPPEFVPLDSASDSVSLKNPSWLHCYSFSLCVSVHPLGFLDAIFRDFGVLGFESCVFCFVQVMCSLCFLLSGCFDQ